jgi:transcriptional regulator with GAF, ATPase, and Fis domain
MTARLLVHSSESQGNVYLLKQTDVFIGRDPNCDIQLAESAVSRRHCVIRNVGQEYQVVDLESSNGTFVDGEKVKECVLSHGQRIRVGDTTILFLKDEHEKTQPNPQMRPHSVSIEFDNESQVERTTITLEIEEAFYLSPDKVEGALPSSSRLARDLSVLLRIGQEINSIQSLEQLQQRLLTLLFDITPAGHAAIILGRHWEDANLSITGENRARVEGETSQPSRTIVSRVWQERVALLCNDVPASSYISPTPSLLITQTQSLLAVPLRVYEKIIGVIYLATNDTLSRFDEGHLQLVTAIGGIAAVSIENVRRIEWLEAETRRLAEEIYSENGIIGNSPNIRAVQRFISKAAPTDSTVLIRGESGTGKELIARAIHGRSHRAARPFVALNCAALTETLLESELFGHEKGAFTGAHALKKGKLEIADGGTVFLDEIGEMPITLQAKLLRVLQDKTFERVGGVKPIQADIRLIAATNRNLEEAITANQFRADLYYRLNVVSVTSPPLRDRKGDIPALAAYFAQKLGENCKRHITGIAEDTMKALINYDWPGNVRELQNALERAVVLGSTPTILLEDLPETILDSQQPITAPLSAPETSAHYLDAAREAKKKTILQSIESAGGNITEAAQALGIHASNLHRLIRTLGIRDLIKK